METDLSEKFKGTDSDLDELISAEHQTELDNLRRSLDERQRRFAGS